MGRLPTVRITNPDEPGSFIVINESDFDEGKHTLFAGEVAEPQAAGSITPDGEGDGEEGSAGEAGSSGLPDGYRIEHAGGGYYFLYAPSGAAIPGPSKGKWQGEDAAQQAAVHHAESHTE